MESVNDSSERLTQNKKSCRKHTLFEDLRHPNSSTTESDLHQVDSCPSDSESGISGTDRDRRFCISDNGLIRIGEGEMIYDNIEKKLLSSLSSNGFSNARVEAIHRRDYSEIMNQVKLQSFSIYAKAMEVKCNGNANFKYAWYGASKNEISGILSHGFGLPTFGQCFCLSPADHPVESVQSSAADEDNVRHMLLCRVILGKVEVINPSSGQHNLNLDEFDSGVDNLASPRKYIVSCSRMNTHILPEFVVSFRASSSCKGCRNRAPPPRLPGSHWMPFATLINVLSKFMPPDAVELIAKHHSDYKKKKLSRYDMIQKVRHIAGDKLLMSIIKSHLRK